MFFEVENVTEKIFRITMPYVCCYLVIGENQAILIDAGWGYGDLKKVVENITQLPVTLLLSHGHPDHNGSANQFDKVYLNEDDFEIIASQNKISLRRQIMLKYVPDDFEEERGMWQPPRTEPYLPLEEGMNFDLGALTIIPFHISGHSKGSMVFIIPEERIAIFGDAISHPTVMFLDSSTKIKPHYEAMSRLKEHSHLYDRVLVNHETYELDKVVLYNNLELAKNILEGKDEKVRASRHLEKLMNVGPVYAARKRKRWLPSDPEAIGNIYYREDKL